MPGDPERTARLRALHDDCVWKVNQAVAEGREDLIQMVSGEYLDRAVRILAEEPPVTGPGPGSCDGSPPAPPRRRRWGGR
jgi:hypothetical protein